MAEARTKVPDSQANAAAAQPGTMGICLSGGGIRAAAFGLGALQSMQEHGILTGPHKADYLAAVSGGSYIATALNLVARGGLPGEPGGEAAVAAADPFARGTPEEQYLRDHTTYLVHGPGGRLVYAGRVVGGILLNVLFLALLLHLVFRPGGWVYGAIFESLRRGYGGGDVTVHLPTLAWLVPLVLVGLGLLLGLVQIAVRWDSDAVRRRLVIWCSRLLKVGHRGRHRRRRHPRPARAHPRRGRPRWAARAGSRPPRPRPRSARPSGWASPPAAGWRAPWLPPCGRCGPGPRRCRPWRAPGAGWPRRGGPSP